KNQAYLVADAAGRVLVDGRPGHLAEVETIAGVDHRGGPGAELLLVEPLEEDRHEQRGHLLVGDLVGRVRGEQPADFGVGERAAVALALDQGDGVGHLFSRRWSRSVVVNAAGSRAWSSAVPCGVSTSRCGPPASMSTWRQRPHGSSGSPSPATIATACSRCPGAVLWRALTRPHSAHRVRP